MHTTYTKEGEKKLKKYKNKLHNRSSASLLAKFMGRFCNFAGVSPGSLVVLFRGEKNKLSSSLFLSAMKCRRSVFSKVKSTVMTYQETGVQDDRLGSSRSKFVLSNQRGRKNWCPRSARTSALIDTIPIFYSRLSECSFSRLQHCTSFYVVSVYIPPGFTK